MDLEKIEELQGKVKLYSAKLLGLEQICTKLNSYKLQVQNNQETNSKTDEEKESILKEILELHNQKKAELINIKAELEILKETLTEELTALKNNPELKLYFNTILDKQYSNRLSQTKRNLEKVSAEKNLLEVKKESLTETKEKFASFKLLLEKNPSLNTAYKNMLVAVIELKKLQKELSLLESSPSKNNNDKILEIKSTLLPQTNNIIDTNMSLLMTHLNETNVNLLDNELLMFTDSYCNYYVDQELKDEIAPLTILDEYNTLATQKLELYDKEITALGLSLSQDTFKYNVLNASQKEVSIKKALLFNKNKKEVEEDKEELQQQSMEENKDYIDANFTQLPATADKPKWYQFIKRIKLWYENSKKPLFRTNRPNQYYYNSFKAYEKNKAADNTDLDISTFIKPKKIVLETFTSTEETIKNNKFKDSLSNPIINELFTEYANNIEQKSREKTLKNSNIER